MPRKVVGLALLLLGLPWASPAAGQEAAADAEWTGVELTPRVQSTLQRLQELWLEWTVAYYQDDAQAAQSVVAQLLATARELGVSRLPDLGFGAQARAVEAARQGELERAAWALEAAGRLDPGRPELDFAAARVARARGSYLGFFGRELRGLLRLSGHPGAGRLVLINGLVWGLWAVLLAGALFLILQMGTKGGGLFRDALRLARPFARREVAYPAAAVVLLWPLALPSGLLWLVVWWSVLLWGYGSASERSVLVGLWLVVGLAPLVAGEGRRQAREELSPPVVAMESLRAGRLYGGFFSDLGVLRSLLPENPAVKHLLADLHRRLGQSDLARALYLEVLAAEPGRAGALLNLGAHAFHSGDFGAAADYFQKAAEADPADPRGYYNLSRAYSEQFFLDEMQEALARAREIDAARVGRWLATSGGERVQVADGGIERVAEIRALLRAGIRRSEGQGAGAQAVRRGLGLLLAAGLALVALALHLARRRFGYSDPPIDLRTSRSVAERCLRALLPGLDAAEAGDGGQALLALLVPVALLLLPLGGRLYYRLPLGHDSGAQGLLWAVALLGLAVYAAVRVAGALRRAA